jgi:hypothetical protein
MNVTQKIPPVWKSVLVSCAADHAGVEVLFTSVEAHSTLVTIGHVDLHRHAAAAERIRAALDGPSPGETLGAYAAFVARAVADSPLAGTHDR